MLIGIVKGESMPHYARLAAAATMLGALLVAPAGHAQPDAPPETGFEQSNGARWTTPEEETGFLETIAAANPEVSVQQIGTTLQHRPLRLVRLGAHHSPSTVLFVCSQHGDEPSGREACLSTIRDLAYSEDPQVAELLRTTTVLFVPTANPDGRVADTRGNAVGTDINRDHITLESPEARAIARVVREHQPDIVHDLHEYTGESPYYDKDVLALWPRNLNTAEPVHDAARALSEEHVRPAVEGAGFTSGVYGIWTDPQTGEPIKQVAGDGQERILRNTIGVKNALGLLVETRQIPLSGEEQNDPAVNNRRRVDSHLVAVQATLRMLVEHRAEIERATTEARLAGLRNEGPVYFGGADNEPPAPGDVENNPPCGYRLTGEQYTQVADELQLHDVRTLPDENGGRYVPMRQPARSLIPLLLDKRAEFHLTEAEPVSCQ